MGRLVAGARPLRRCCASRVPRTRAFLAAAEPAAAPSERRAPAAAPPRARTPRPGSPRRLGTRCDRGAVPAARSGTGRHQTPRGSEALARAVPAICSGRAGCRGLRGSPPPRLALSTTSWSARQKRPSSRSANSSPGMSWRLQATQRKHSMWYTLARARITKSFLLKPMLHLAHLMPYNLSRAQPRKKEKGGKEGEHGRGKGEGREGAGGEKEREKERGFHSRSCAAPGPA